MTTTKKNRFGELQTEWTSHKHPTNPNFMQIVKYMHIQKADGSTALHWRLFNSASNDVYHIWNISLNDAISKYTDEEEVEITDDMFNKWLANRKS